MSNDKLTKDMIKIDTTTGKAIVPDWECVEVEYRDVNWNDPIDTIKVDNLYRRLNVVKSMNIIVKSANDEMMIYESGWLYLMDDGAHTLEDFYYYVNDDDYFELVKLFKELISEYDIHDITY